MAKPQMYSMKWNNYQNHIGGIFIKLLEAETMVDLTLCADGEKISCHRIMLSACSPYFKEILSEINSSHAVVILCGISGEDARSIVEFVYKGELNVSSERFPSVIKAAEALKICGLMEVSNHLPVLQVINAKDDISASSVNEVEETDNLLYVKEEVFSTEEGIMTLGSDLEVISSNNTDDQENDCNIIADDSEGQSNFGLEIATSPKEKRKRKREFSKRDYSEDALSAALDDLARGRSLLETSNAHHIPRSTLYTRARNYGITPTIVRQEYTEEKLAAAVETVKEGASLQTAALMYSIPKTVLWRRVQKDIGCYALSRRARLRQRYQPHTKEEAIRALESGEGIHKVALKYKIPKTTLFREKSRLVEAGKLPLSCLKRRAPYKDRFKQVRLTQAIAACKEGRMSQSAASSTYQVSKTTIWRRLQQCGEKKHLEFYEAKADDLVSSDLDFQEVTEIPVTYCDDRETYPLIILTPNTTLTNEISYQSSDDIIVDSVLDTENVENVGEVIEIQETPSYCEEIAVCQNEEYSEDLP